MVPRDAATPAKGTRKTPNTVLRRIREQECHQTREEFADAMAEVARRIGEPVFPDAKYVARLETGDIKYPRPIYRRILAELCGRPFGELGFRPTSGPLSLPAMPDSAKPEAGDYGAIPAKRTNLALRDAVLASGLELPQIARRVGVDKKSVERWIMRGVVPHPRHRWKACEVLGRDESELWPDVIPVPERLAAIPSQPLHDHGIHPYDPMLGRGDIRPMLNNITGHTAIPALSALGEIHRGYVLADSMMGGLSVTDAVRTQVPLIERICETSRGDDRRQALQFACRFMEFCGWVHQDAGDVACGMYFTDRAFDYAMELGDQRTIAYTLMRKASIATDAGNPVQGLGVVNRALSNADALTPRLRAVIFRQRAHAHAALRESSEAERDSESAIAEAVAGVSQGEEDRAPYCSPMYAAMETGYSMVLAGRPKSALPALARSRSEWSDHNQVRDYALCVARLATTYAEAGEADRARATAEEAITLADGMGSRRIINQLSDLSRGLRKWRNDPTISATQDELNKLVVSFNREHIS